MKLSAETIHHIAKLSRITLRPEEASLFAAEIGEVLGYVDRLNDIDTTSVSPSFRAALTENALNVSREDIVGEMFSPEEAVQNASEHEGGAFVVPRIIG
jgi:aspartyl-tRNA(Asn)/glutamyl-tRNA(Gln) amidotransferase subunit C